MLDSREVLNMGEVPHPAWLCAADRSFRIWDVPFLIIFCVGFLPFFGCSYPDLPALDPCLVCWSQHILPQGVKIPFHLH